MPSFNRQNFFVSECHFKSNGRDWAKNYLHKKDYRITEMVLPILKFDFLNAYGLTLQAFVKNNQLILRAKLYDEKQNSICLFQIWKTRKCYKRFLKEVKATKFEKAIRSTGLRFEKKITEKVSSSFLHEQIEQMKFKRAIWQFVNPIFKKDWMVIGDPIRDPGLK